MTAGTARSTVVTCPHCGKRNRVPVSAGSVPKCGNCHERLPWIADAGDDDFAEVAEQAPVPVLVDLWATWCGPCRMVSPALERLATQRAGELKLVKVDVDKAPRLSQRFEVRAVPQGCEECLRIGSPWVHLRLCLTCGHVGCCDQSPGRHSRR